MNNKLIKLFKDHIYFPDDYTKLHWKEEYGSISYNTDNELSDLMEGEGNTYSGEVRSEVEIDDYVMYELDSGCGWNYQAIFSLSNKVDINAYWESEGD